MCAVDSLSLSGSSPQVCVHSRQSQRERDGTAAKEVDVDTESAECGHDCITCTLALAGRAGFHPTCAVTQARASFYTMLFLGCLIYCTQSAVFSVFKVPRHTVWSPRCSALCFVFFFFFFVVVVVVFVFVFPSALSHSVSVSPGARILLLSAGRLGLSGHRMSGQYGPTLSLLARCSV